MNKNLKGFFYFSNQILGSYKQTSFLSKAKLELFNQNRSNRFVTQIHDVCLTGPPRSANTFIKNVFEVWNPNSLIAHHVHLPNQVLLAVKWRIPCVVLLRKPEDSIASLLALGGLPVGIAIKSYINYYEKIKKQRKMILVLSFKDAINDPKKMIDGFNKIYGTDFCSKPLSIGERENIFSKIKNNPNRKKELLIAIPDEKKEHLKNLVKPKVMNHFLFEKATNIYQEWLKYSVK